MEYLDIYDEFGNFIGTETRDKVHKDGLWHKTVHCWLYDKEGNVYFQIRKDRKTLYTTASGHVQAGETVEEAFTREIQEEIGISLLPQDTIFLKMNPFTMDKVKSDGTLFKDRAFANIYLSEWKDSVSHFAFDEEELDGIAKVNAKETWELFKGNRKSVQGVRIAIKEKKRIEEEKEFILSDFLLNEGETLLEKYGFVLEKIVELVGEKEKDESK